MQALRLQVVRRAAPPARLAAGGLAAVVRRADLRARLRVAVRALHSPKAVRFPRSDRQNARTCRRTWVRRGAAFCAATTNGTAIRRYTPPVPPEFKQERRAARGPHLWVHGRTTAWRSVPRAARQQGPRCGRVREACGPVHWSAPTAHDRGRCPPSTKRAVRGQKRKRSTPRSFDCPGSRSCSPRRALSSQRLAGAVAAAP
jgi:hypothetical protein